MLIPLSVINLADSNLNNSCTVYRPRYWAKAYRRLWERSARKKAVVTCVVEEYPINPDEARLKAAYEDGKIAFNAGTLKDAERPELGPGKVLERLKQEYEAVAYARYQEVSSVDAEYRLLESTFKDITSLIWPNLSDLEQDINDAIEETATKETELFGNVKKDLIANQSYIDLGLSKDIAVALQSAGFANVKACIGITTLEIMKATSLTSSDASALQEQLIAGNSLDSDTTNSTKE